MSCGTCGSGSVLDRALELADVARGSCASPSAFEEPQSCSHTRVQGVAHALHCRSGEARACGEGAAEPLNAPSTVVQASPYI